MFEENWEEEIARREKEIARREKEVSDGELVEAVEEYEVSYWNVFYLFACLNTIVNELLFFTLELLRFATCGA